ncbi:putative cRISPR-associated protein [Corynebacterium simulans]|nr:putative cRISPR-associated protein [Corynebacterium simulans]
MIWSQLCKAKNGTPPKVIGKPERETLYYRYTATQEKGREE